VTWTRWAASTLAVAALVALAVSCATTQQPTAAAEDPVARGKRVAFTSGCVDCHTPGTFYGAMDTTRMLSGSELGWQGPWGITYSRNLTPDVSTGLGSWTEEQIVTAIREGRRPDGTPILPPMPWPMFSQLTDEDAHALARYLKSLPPIVHEMPKAQAPGERPARPILTFPAPPEWDARNLPPPPAAAGK